LVKAVRDARGGKVASSRGNATDAGEVRRSLRRDCKHYYYNQKYRSLDVK
jgi:hypothetical protein